MRLKRIGFGTLTVFILVALVGSNLAFGADNGVGNHQAPTLPCSILDGYFNAVNYIPQASSATMAGEQYWLSYNNTTVSTKVKFIVKYHSGSAQSKEVQQYSDI